MGFVIFNSPSEKIGLRAKHVSAVALAKCFARSKNPKADCSSGVGGVCAWVPRNGMGGNLQLE